MQLEYRRQVAIKHEAEIAIKTEAIRKIVEDTNHRGLWPIFRTLRGILNLVRLACTHPHVSGYITEAEEQIKLAESIVMDEVKKIEPLQ